MKSNKFLNSLLIPFLALPALAGVEVTKDGNKFVVRSCENYTDKSAVSFTIGDNGIPQFELAKNGCATKTYTEGIVKVGDIINIVGGNKKSKAVISEKTKTDGDSKPGSDSAYTSDIGPIILKAELIDSTTVELQGCNPKLKMSDAISVTNRSSKKMGVSKIASVKKINGETCFVVQFKKGEINSHDEIGVGISSVAKPVVLTVVNIPWKTQQSKPVDTKPIDTKPVDTTPVVPVDPGSGTVEVDNRKTLSTYEVTKIAEQAANRFANQVVNNLGQIENIRYNLYLGFRQAENQFGHNYKYYDEYSQGQKDGEVRGYNSGLQAGRSYGAQQGSALAREEVVQAFENAFATGKKPAPSPRAELKASFGGLESNTSNPISVEERLKAKDQKIQNELKTITILEDGIILGDDVYVTYYKAYDLYSLKDYKFDYLLSFYRGERAYVAWYENMFKDSKGMQDRFNEITNPSLYKDSNENRQAFYNAFVNRYDEIISQKWNKAVTKENLKARALGTQIYLETVREYAYELGLVSTLRPAYKNASVLGFNETLYPSYFSTYKSTFNTYSTSAVITDISVSAPTFLVLDCNLVAQRWYYRSILLLI